MSTWKRELKEKDFSSGIFAYLVSKGFVSARDLSEMDEGKIVEIVETSNAVEYFLDKWRENYRKVEEIGKGMKSVDVKALLRGFETLLKFHLATEGYK